MNAHTAISNLFSTSNYLLLGREGGIKKLSKENTRWEERKNVAEVGKGREGSKGGKGNKLLAR